MKKHYYIRINEEGIEACDFSIYGNDCRYNVDVFDGRKRRIGSGNLDVRNMGTEADYDFVYEYDCNDPDAREELADLLGVDEIKENWYNEDGELILDKYDGDFNMPEDICEQICRRLDEDHENMMLDCYADEFCEMADDKGLVSLDDFIANYQVMRSGFGKKSDWQSVDDIVELEQFFEDCGFLSLDDEPTIEMTLNNVVFERNPTSVRYIPEVECCGIFLGKIFIDDNGTMLKKVSKPVTYSDDEGREYKRDFDYEEADINKTYHISMQYVGYNDLKFEFYKGKRQVTFEEIEEKYIKEVEKESCN